MEWIILLLLICAALSQQCPVDCMCKGTTVDCSSKNLNAFPDKIPEYTTELILSNNNIMALRKVDVEQLKELKSLELKNNSISEIEQNILDVLPELTKLGLDMNKLRSIPQLASNPHSKIETLNFSENMISKVDKSIIKENPTVKVFTISKNRLQSLPNNFFPRHRFLENSSLRRNPWTCDCRILQVKKYAEYLMKIDANNQFTPRCLFPPHLKGELLTDIPDEKLQCSKPIIVAHRDEKIFDCPVEKEDSVRFKVTWLDKNLDPVLPDDELHQLRNGSLVTSPLSSKQRNSRFTLHFTFQQPPTSSRDGEVLDLVCEAAGNPSPTISWMFGSTKIIESRKHKLMRGGRTLRIWPFLESDVGKYTCIAKNDNGAISHTVPVTLISSEKPNIFDPPMETKANIGQSVTLRCKARGVPKPDIVWLFEGTRIPRKNTRYTISDDNTELNIEKVTRHDSGVYTCQAVSTAGSDVAQATMTVGQELTNQVDELLSKETIDMIAMQAKGNVESAYKSTKESLKIDKIENPQDLRKLFKFAIPLKKVDLGKAREIYEESLRLVQIHIDKGLKLSPTVIAPNVSYEAVLPVNYVQTLMEKSGCQTGQFVESCDDICFFSKYRSYDGQCNNFEHPMRGVSEMAFLRLLPPRYENGFNTPVGWEKGKLYNGFEVPNARKVSRLLIGTDEITPHDHLSSMTMQWGQFIDHDMTLTAPALTRHSYKEGAFCNRTCENIDPCFNIQLEPDDPKLHTGLYQKYPCMEFERNGAICGSGETSPIFQRVTYRDQMNVLTSYLDASGIYGNSEEQALALRDLFSDHGLLRFDIVSAANKPYLPFEKEDDMDCRRNYSRENPINCFLAGDIRANEQLGLMSMHTIFMREHNRIAGKLLEANENWDGETIFQETRKIIGAILQKITYDDWLPKILGRATYNEVIGPYKGYNPDVDATISNEFATAALRFAHTLINPQLFRFDKNFTVIKEGHIPLHNAFFAPERLVSEGGVDPILRGLFAAPIKLPKPDQILNKELTEKLFNKYHEVALDLAAFNIQRGRDHGLPTWTEYRKFCNLSVPKTWNDLKSIVQDETVILKLEKLYGSPENIDLWVGGVTEKRTSEALMGPTLACIIADQFRRTRDGDRFWYENDEVFTKMQLRQIKKVTLAKIICMNGDDIDRVQRDIFVYHGDKMQFYEKCENLPEMNLNMWTTCCDTTCSLSAGVTRNTVDEVKKRKRRDKNLKVCTENKKVYRSGEKWINSDDKCVQCMCDDASFAMESIHEQHCDNCFNGRCDYSQCTLNECAFCFVKLHSCKIPDHVENICRKSTIKCPNFTYGCPHKFMRFKMSSHLENCPCSVVVCGRERSRKAQNKSNTTMLKNWGKSPTRWDFKLEDKDIDVGLALIDQIDLNVENLPESMIKNDNASVVKNGGKLYTFRCLKIVKRTEFANHSLMQHSLTTDQMELWVTRLMNYLSNFCIKEDNFCQNPTEMGPTMFENLPLWLYEHLSQFLTGTALFNLSSTNRIVRAKVFAACRSHTYIDQKWVKPNPDGGWITEKPVKKNILIT
ncbi:unnamed protein product [Caenorhabditis bovis]|uniref:Peroxidase n=1 Tax=Caenorhabditis bovis TaxID=2654633 RepID=A0A8S1ESN8_9PELO|nr:unnamed protein product [Caenorhabditis bovis]